METGRLKKILFIIIFLLYFIVYEANTQQLYDLSRVSEDKVIIDSTVVVGHEKELRAILLVAIEISVLNIINSEATLTSIFGMPYKYKYVVVLQDFSFSVMEEERIKLVYNPTHPNRLEGDLEGYVWYPDINIQKESSDIFAMLDILWALDGIEIITEYVKNSKTDSSE